MNKKLFLLMVIVFSTTESWAFIRFVNRSSYAISLVVYLMGCRADRHFLLRNKTFELPSGTCITRNISAETMEFKNDDWVGTGKGIDHDRRLSPHGDWQITFKDKEGKPGELYWEETSFAGLGDFKEVNK